MSPIDRRSFLKKAGAFALGCAFCGTMTGCFEDSIDVPCLGTAEPPTPVEGMTYVRASEIGCALDCDLKTGHNKYTGFDATDDAPKINAALAQASAAHPITLILDGSALISGLFLPTGGHWAIAGLGCGTGFFIKDAANSDGIHNGPRQASDPFDPGPPAPLRGANVSLSNFAINGNQYHDSTQSTKQGSKTVWYCGIDLMNLDDIKIENVVVVNTPAYHIRLSNVGSVTVSGCVLQTKGASSDGIHVDGPANDIKISNCSFKTSDDSIALNCPEGYSGDISRITVTECNFASWSLMRLYTTNGNPAVKFRIDSVTVDSCTGTLAEAAFLVGLSPWSLPKSIASLTVSNCYLVAPAILGIAENFGDIVLQNIEFVPSQANVSWTLPQVNRTSAFLRPSPQFGAAPFKWSSLTFQNCEVYRVSNDADTASVVLDNQTSIDLIEFDGFELQDARPLPPIASLIQVQGGSVGQLVLNAINSTNIAAPFGGNQSSLIGSISGAGVLQTGWTFSDSEMKDGVPYVSASTGQPSIKVSGVIKPYQMA